MYIPKITGNPAFLPYIFKLRKYRIVHGVGDKLTIYNGLRYKHPEDWDGRGIFSSVDEIVTALPNNFLTSRDYVDLSIEGEIDDKWINLQNIEIVHALTTI